MIKISGLNFKYDGANDFALRDINIEAKKGDFLGIIGKSGSGKTTLLQSIGGIVPHYMTGDFYGCVEVNGIDTATCQPEDLSQYVGSVSRDVESQTLCSVVEDEILFGLENFNLDREEIAKRMQTALDMVGIADLKDRSIASLSGGQRQKVAVCAILALMPQILVLDEPTAELDPQSSRRIFALLRELNEKYGMTIIVAEQKIMLLCEFVKHLAVMKDGKILVQGAVREVLDHPDKLTEAGVNSPRVATFCSELKSRGLYSGSVPVNVEEAVAMAKEALDA